MTTTTATALVTGSTRGIGEAIARGLAAKGMSVIVTGRDAKAGEKIAKELGRESAFVSLDLEKAEDIESIAKLVEARGGLDVLVNNAGASFDGFNAEVAKRTLDVNFVSMMTLTDRLVPHLHKNARVVMVSSGMGEVDCLSAALQREVLDENLDRAKLLAFTNRFIAEVKAGTQTKSGWPSNAYRVSKVAMNAYVRILARDLSSTSSASNIAVNAACPGWVRTAMGGKSAPRTVDQGAKTPIFLATLPNEDAPSGKFFRDEQEVGW